MSDISQNMISKPALRLAETSKDFDQARALFEAFADQLPISLAFQGFDAEMQTLASIYEIILLAEIDGQAVGALALKKHDDDTCEMKRMYVAPNGRGLGLGKRLSERLIMEAKSRGYKIMLLDSLKRLTHAIALYQHLGFQERQPYNFNPEDDVVYMQKKL